VLEQEVKYFLSATSGQMLMLLGQVMMAGDTAFNDFEQRLKQFGQQLASDSQQLEQQANQLCQKIERLDALESDLQRQIPRLANFDLVKIKFI
jgi:TolA-binding protein